MHYFDESPSFHIFDNICRLTAQLDLSDKLELCADTPEVGRRFNAATKLPFTYTVDEYYILHAHLKNFDEERLRTIRFVLSHAFPGLPTFFRVHQTQAELVVKGINLPEQHESLTRFFNSYVKNDHFTEAENDSEPTFLEKSALFDKPRKRLKHFRVYQNFRGNYSVLSREPTFRGLSEESRDR